MFQFSLGDAVADCDCHVKLSECWFVLCVPHEKSFVCHHQIKHRTDGAKPFMYLRISTCEFKHIEFFMVFCHSFTISICFAFVECHGKNNQRHKRQISRFVHSSSIENQKMENKFEQKLKHWKPKINKWIPSEILSQNFWSDDFEFKFFVSHPFVCPVFTIAHYTYCPPD